MLCILFNTKETFMPGSKFYIKQASGFSQEIDDSIISPLFYQPTPEGVGFLCSHYSAKYKIDLRCLDLRGKVTQPDNILMFFECLVKINLIERLDDNQVVGIVLSHGQHHAVPVLIHKREGKTEVVVFDSTSGPRIKGYFRIATLFPSSVFYLNSGSRQVDSSSCITDAICILKEALQIENLLTLLNHKRYDEHPSLQSKRSGFFSIPKPDNFILFKMPEKLLLTAQKSRYVSEADANTSIQLRGGKTLAEYRSLFQMRVSLIQGDSATVKGINSYLFIKSREHKKLFDSYSKKIDIKPEEKEVRRTKVAEPLILSERTRNFLVYLDIREKRMREKLQKESKPITGANVQTGVSGRKFPF